MAFFLQWIILIARADYHYLKGVQFVLLPGGRRFRQGPPDRDGTAGAESANLIVVRDTRFHHDLQAGH
jgi:hypothetical protein